MQNHLNEILMVLSEKNVEFVVAGGVAVVLHEVERLTLDLDLAVKMTPWFFSFIDHHQPIRQVIFF